MRVTARVVDALEVVDVEHHHGQRAPVAAGELELLAQDLLEAAVVGQARERVAVGQFLEPAVVLLEVDGHRVEVSRELAELVAPSPAEPGVQGAGAHGAGGQAQAAERAEDPALEQHGGEEHEAGQQAYQHDQEALVSLREQLVSRTQVVADRERTLHLPAAPQRGHERLGVATAAVQLGAHLLAGADRLDREAQLLLPARAAPGRHHRGAAAGAVDRGRHELRDGLRPASSARPAGGPRSRTRRRCARPRSRPWPPEA